MESLRICRVKPEAMASRPGPYPLNVRLGVRLCRWDLHGHPGEPPPNTGPATARRQGLKARERKAPPVRHTRPAAQSKSRRSLPVPVLPRTPPTGSLPRLATPGPDPAAAPQTPHRPLSLRRTFSNRSRAAAPPRPRALARRAAATSVCVLTSAPSYWLRITASSRTMCGPN